MQNYTVDIFVDNVLTDTQTGTVAGAITPPADEDDPFPLVSISKSFVVE